jgi:hypothetical protein
MTIFLRVKLLKMSLKKVLHALTLSTYNTVQISKLENAIEAQKQQSDLLADIDDQGH